jgi:hypothetical protein
MLATEALGFCKLSLMVILLGVQKTSMGIQMSTVKTVHEVSGGNKDSVQNWTVVVHLCMEAMLGISLYSYPYLN